MTTLKLDSAPMETRARVVTLRANVGGVDRDGRGTLRGLSAITRGEALGHELWIDDAFLDQLTAAGKGLPKGAKARFTHPGMSSDGLGKYLGRAQRFERDGDQVRVDLALSPTAARTPDGDLAGYVLDLADEDANAFGASIVFERDREAEEIFLLENGAQTNRYSAVGNSVLSAADRGFKSPDPRNKKNLGHARLKGLHAVDLVDDPAANPNGLFSSHPTYALLESSDAAAAFLLGLSEQPPASLGGIDPTRARAFVTRFLDQRGLAVARKDVPMTDVGPLATSTQPPAPAAHVPAVLGVALAAATLAQLKAEFGSKPGFMVEQLEKGATLEQARSAFQVARIAELEKTNEELRQKNATAAATSTLRASERPRSSVGIEPLQFAPEGTTSAGAGGDIREAARAYRDELHPEFAGTSQGMEEAMRVVSRREEYQSWRKANGIRPLARKATH